ncbi:dTDP-4-dehydrorhamnose 3,5-epimerase [Cohnella terricola]|uniref:dTDP-4-dehydrorhamnose 3,5-epimerase n=1 Tax=Cohnella terricola TaxID=1289167 RepID=A0A559JB05_9BACL|nr:dTDP-4-dehydrorhamnose 3,5-epimerase [Cohnella terricola]TVX97062.1 dTDP-4-dehydrorhamnose 3,5-epimerase [Cohnella terricola]
MKIREGQILKDIIVIEPTVYEDNRGFFLESYNKEKLAKAGITAEFVQDNHSLSLEVGVIRGLHYQLNPHAQSKLVRVTSGAIYDIVVDIRQGSPTFGKWEGFELSSRNKLQLFVPKGFAHGFCTLESRTEVQYKVDCFYSPEHDRGIAWNDPGLGIQWPVTPPVLSSKDIGHPLIGDADNNFVY